MDSIEFQGSVLLSLHELLPDVLTVPDLGPSFAKFLRAKREELHPIGVEDIRSVETVSGLKLNVNLGDRLGCDFFYGFFQEMHDAELLMALVRPGSVFVDVGANIGYYALEAGLRAGPAGRVVAIEPDPRSVQLLVHNIGQNGLDARTRVVAACAGPRDDEIDFFAAAEPSFSGMRDNRRSPVVSVSKVAMRSLDSLLAEIGCTRVDFIKIDVEGFEADVLDGAGNTLADSDPVIMVELSQKNADDGHPGRRADVLSVAAECGYSALSVSSDGKRLSLHPARMEPSPPDSEPSSGNYFLARRETGALRRLEEALHAKTRATPARSRLFKHGPAAFSDAQRSALAEVLEFFQIKFTQAYAGREAYRQQLEQAHAELAQARASRDAHRQQLEQANAELAQARASRDAHRQQLEQVRAELAQALSQLELLKAGTEK